MLNIAYTHASVVLVIFHYHMLQNKQSDRHSYIHIQYDVGGCVLCISNKVEYLNKEEKYKNSTKEVTLQFKLIFSMQSTKCWAKFGFIISIFSSIQEIHCTIKEDIFFEPL